MFHIAICDDVSSDLKEIQDTLISIQNVEQKYKFYIVPYIKGELLLIDLEEKKYTFDLIILDIYMNGISGMEIARKIREKCINTPIIFLTASPDFALESYDVNAFGYLLKPVNQYKLMSIIDRLLIQYDRPRICIQCKRQKRYIFLDEVMYAESRNHNIYIYMSNGEVLISSEKLNNLENMLNKNFLRCHQSFLVNMNYIVDVTEDFILKDGTKIPIRIRQRKAIADEYYRFFVKHTLK